MKPAIFLSASVPEAGRAGYESANRLLIREAVAALAEVILGRRLLVWGGQPAITPMMWAAAEGLGAVYSTSVHLFQSSYWADRYPEDNKRFGNVTYVPAVPDDKAASLLALRTAMFRRYVYSAAVFIGGMEGVVHEYELFGEMCPGAKRVCLASPGGVSRMLFDRDGGDDFERDSIDFTRMLYRDLQIDTDERREGIDGTLL